MQIKVEWLCCISSPEGLLTKRQWSPLQSVRGCLKKPTPCWKFCVCQMGGDMVVGEGLASTEAEGQVKWNNHVHEVYHKTPLWVSRGRVPLNSSCWEQTTRESCWIGLLESQSWENRWILGLIQWAASHLWRLKILHRSQVTALCINRAYLPLHSCQNSSRKC